MSREIAQAIGAKKFGLLLILLTALAILATLGSQWQRSNSASHSSKTPVVPAGLSFPSSPLKADAGVALSSASAVYSLVDPVSFIQRLESGVVVASPGNVHVVDNSQVSSITSPTDLLIGSHSSMPCAVSLCGVRANIFDNSATFGFVITNVSYPGLTWLFQTANLAEMVALSAVTFAVLALPESLRRDFLQHLTRRGISKRYLIYSQLAAVGSAPTL